MFGIKWQRFLVEISLFCEFDQSKLLQGKYIFASIVNIYYLFHYWTKEGVFLFSWHNNTQHNDS